MAFFTFLHRHKLFVHYLTVVIVILGLMAVFKIRREARPNVNFHRVTISAGYPGASASDIEKLIIEPIESKISEVDGVEEFRSVSFPGSGSISVKIDDEYPDAESVVDELRRKISEIKNLPQGVNTPVVLEHKADNIPVLSIALYGNMKPLDLKLEVEKLKDFLKNFEGVQSVSYAGLQDLQLKILTYPERLDQYDLTLLEVINGLGLWVKQRPGGLLINSHQTTNLTVGRDYNEIGKLENFIIRSNDSGQNVKLSDISEVVFDTETTQQRSLYGDKDAVLITIVKKPTYDAVKIVDEIKKRLKTYEKSLPPELSYKLYNDQSKRVRDRLSVVQVNALFGLFLVLVLLIIFLDWRTALVASIGIPIAILGGIGVIYLFGSTLNTLVIIGMIIVLGMLVDDAIVVCENIYSHIEGGMGPYRASIQGVSEIAAPVIATVLTTVFAFFPILFMSEVMGQFLRVIPMTVIAMLLVSLFEALIILPVHAEELMKPRKKKQRLFDKIERKYKRYVEWSIKKRHYIVAALLVLTVISFLQGRALFQKFTLFPASGLNGLSVRIEAGKNNSLEKTTSIIKRLNTALEAASEGTYEKIISTVGQVTTGGRNGSRQNGSHLGVINISFTSDPSFIDKEKRIVKNIRDVVGKFKEENKLRVSIGLDRPGPPIGKPIHFQVTARDLVYGQKIVDTIKAELLNIKGVQGIETDLDGDNVKYRFEVDNSQAISEGVDPNTIAQTIFAASTGRVTNEILKNNEKVEILVTVAKKLDLNVNEILNLKVRNSNRQAVPMSSFTKVFKEKGPSSIQRFNGVRTITLFGEVDEKIISGKEANLKIAPLIKKLKIDNPSIRIVTGGGERDRMRALRETMKLYLFAIVLIFMTISLSFRSTVYPFLVLSVVPMGICGVVWSLTLHGAGLTLMGLIGVVGLSGVVVNVSIILLKFIQEKVKMGVPFNEAIVLGGVRRLRAIVITTITTLIGLAPTIYGIGGVDTFVQPLALVLGWGLFVATVLTIFTLPAIISFFSFLGGKRYVFES